jgi:DNA repair exonuclease SbcCD ATPase subunit
VADRNDDRIRELEQKIDALQDERRAMAEELGRLRALAERLGAVEKERDALREAHDRLLTELTDLRARFDQRVGEEVQAALASVTEEHERTAREWEKERARLLGRIAELEATTADVGEVVGTKDLAAQFRNVLETFSEPEPEGGTAGAALTGLEVEARAILSPPAEGEELPRLRMVDPTQVTNPEALSTVRMRFGLLPRLPSEPPEG